MAPQYNRNITLILQIFQKKFRHCLYSSLKTKILVMCSLVQHKRSTIDLIIVTVLVDSQNYDLDKIILTGKTSLTSMKMKQIN